MDGKNVFPERKLKALAAADVIVCGGGPSGAAAVFPSVSRRDTCTANFHILPETGLTHPEKSAVLLNNHDNLERRRVLC